MPELLTKTDPAPARHSSRESCSHEKRRHESGMLLIEALVAMVIVAVLGRLWAILYSGGAKNAGVV